MTPADQTWAPTVSSDHSTVRVSSPASARQVEVIEIVHVHEPGTPTGNMTTSRVIPAKDRDTEVRLISRVGTYSPAYYAAVRRKRASLIAKKIANLETQSHRAGLDFSACTLPITEALKDLIGSVLIDSESEGNSREVLRVVRDSFLNGGWMHYRRQEQRQRAISSLDLLANQEEITPKHVETAIAALGDVVDNLLNGATEDGNIEIPDRNVGKPPDGGHVG